MKLDQREEASQGYVTFEEPTSAVKAIKVLNQTRVEESFIYVMQHLSKRDLELQLKQPNSSVKNQQIQQNRNTIVIKNYSKVTTDEIIASIQRFGKVLDHKHSEMKSGNGSIIFATLQHQQMVQEVIQKMNTMSALVIEQWVSPELLKIENEKRKEEKTTQFLNALMNTTQNPERFPAGG